MDSIKFVHTSAYDGTQTSIKLHVTGLCLDRNEGMSALEVHGLLDDVEMGPEDPMCLNREWYCGPFDILKMAVLGYLNCDGALEFSVVPKELKKFKEQFEYVTTKTGREIPKTYVMMDGRDIFTFVYSDFITEKNAFYRLTKVAYTNPVEEYQIVTDAKGKLITADKELYDVALVKASKSNEGVLHKSESLSRYIDEINA